MWPTTETRQRWSARGRVLLTQTSLRNVYVAAFGHPFTAAFLAVLAPIAGVWITFRREFITRSLEGVYPLAKQPFGGNYGDIIVFFILLSVLGIGFTLHKHAEATKTADRLDALKTLPPKGILERFETYFHKSYWGARAGFESPADRTKIIEGIRSILQGLVSLAAYFNGSPGGARYSINVMVFENFDVILPDAAKTYWGKASFVEQGIGYESARGILRLIPQLSIALINENLQDESLPELVLPIPKREFAMDGGQTTVLPGAPRAFCSGAHFFCHDTKELGKECRDATALRASVATQVEMFFNNGLGKDIRSFVCLPIGIPRATDEPQMLGVVNLHSNQPDCFRGDSAALFGSLSAPYRFLLAELLQACFTLPPGNVEASLPPAEV
jgi:hypothetical protein